MSKKQLVGLIVAVALFIVTAASSVIVNTWSSNSMKVNDELNSLSGSYGPSNEDFVAVIPIEGTIQASSSTGYFSSSEGYDHDYSMAYVDSLIENSHNKGILLEIDTPGGSVYETDEFYLKLMEYKEETGRPIYAYMQSQACSGGFYISMAADEIYANRNCWTGSIGVIVSMTNYKGLYDKLGIQEIDITSGPNKSMGSAGLELTDQQRAILQSLVDESYEQFTSIVAEGRNMNITKVKQLADGRIYTAQQALDNDLIDGIMGLEDYENEVLAKVGSNVTLYKPDDTLSTFTSLFSQKQDVVEKSDAQILQELMDNEGSGVPLYYAEQLY